MGTLLVLGRIVNDSSNKAGDMVAEAADAPVAEATAEATTVEACDELVLEDFLGREPLVELGSRMAPDFRLDFFSFSFSALSFSALSFSFSTAEVGSGEVDPRGETGGTSAESGEWTVRRP